MGTVVYLPCADRMCGDCGCTKAVARGSERVDPLLGLQPVKVCGACGDRVEDIGPIRTLQQSAGVAHCDECGAVRDDLVACTIALPGSAGSGNIFLCNGCLSAYDDADDIQEA